MNNVEEALIARNCVCMSAYRLKGGSFGFRGNVISFPQEIADVCSVLPRLPQNCGVFRVRSLRNSSAAEYIDFMVRRERVKKWLIFLKKWSLAYTDINISEDNLLALPVEGSVYDDLQVLGNDENTEDEDMDEDIDMKVMAKIMMIFLIA